MSHQATRWALRQRGLKPATKIVLFYLCDHHNDEKGCFPSQELLASECEMSRSTLNLHLAKLEGLGLIRRVSSIDERTKRQRPTRYVLQIDADVRVRKSDRPASEKHTQPVSGKQADPCPNTDRAHVRFSDTNPVREPVRETTTVREAADAAVAVAPEMIRRAEILTLMGCPDGITVQGRIVGTTNDLQECRKWDALGLSRPEQDAKIREMLDGKRRSEPGFMPQTWRWFTPGMQCLAEEKSAKPPSIGRPHTMTAEQRNRRYAAIVGE